MLVKKDNAAAGDVALQNGGSITYANEVIAIIAGVAASEVEGVTGMCAAGGINEKIGKNRNVTKGVKVELGTEEVSIELYMVVEYSKPIQKVAADVQENVRKAVESMTGLHVVNIDVHVQGISFEKDKTANLTAGEKAQALKESEEKPAKAAGGKKPAEEKEAETAKETQAEAKEEVKEEEKEAAAEENADADKTAFEEPEATADKAEEEVTVHAENAAEETAEIPEKNGEQ